ncbi:hypothetical protein CGRA01v4_06741 [Colletotrichum graminicola]|nr:hypothetical protein CGRA01v4_06741 [Colletotrichum graminicola]
MHQQAAYQVRIRSKCAGISGQSLFVKE